MFLAHAFDSRKANISPAAAPESAGMHSLSDLASSFLWGMHETCWSPLRVNGHHVKHGDCGLASSLMM